MKIEFKIADPKEIAFWLTTVSCSTNHFYHQPSSPSIQKLQMASKALTKALPKSLKEVRLHLCQTGQASAGAR